MTKTDNGVEPRFLQETVVALAGARFDKFYHHLSGVHIVKQLGGTEFRMPGISGTGQFADEAYAAYLAALRSFVSGLTEQRLRELERRLSDFAPVGARKVEVQVQLPGTLAHKIDAQAKAMNVGIDTYLNLILDDCLYLNLDNEDETSAWLQTFVQQRQQFTYGVELARCTMYLSLPLSGFEGLERLTARLASNHLNTVSEFVSNVLLFRKWRDNVDLISDQGRSSSYSKREAAVSAVPARIEGAAY